MRRCRVAHLAERFWKSSGVMVDYSRQAAQHEDAIGPIPSEKKALMDPNYDRFRSTLQLVVLVWA